MATMHRAEARPTPPPGRLDPPWEALREANFLLRERGTRALQEFGLTYSDFAILDLCSRAPAKASDVARRLGVSAAGATDAIDRLEARRLVRRVPDPTDRRVVLIRPTPGGERLHAQGASVKEAIVRYLGQAMTAAERASLAEGLGALRRALRDAPGRL